MTTVRRATDKEQRRLGVRLIIKSDWRKQYPAGSYTTVNYFGGLEHRKHTELKVTSQWYANALGIDHADAVARIDRQRSLMAHCEPGSGGLLAESHDGPELPHVEILPPPVEILAPAEPLTALADRLHDFRLQNDEPVAPASGTFYQRIAAPGEFDASYTQAALASGMTPAEIDARDDAADKVRAFDKLVNTCPELQNDDMIRAAGLDPAQWRDADETDETDMSFLPDDGGSYDVEADIGATYLAADFKAWRNKLGWSQPETARRLDLSEITVRRYETGLQPIPRCVAMAAWALAVSLT